MRRAAPGRFGEALFLLATRALWTGRFASDPALVGRAVTMNGTRLTVVGVAPRGFSGLSGTAEAWLPMATAGLAATGTWGVVGHAVASRRRELGLRLALGARDGSVLAMVVRGSLSAALVGVAFGLAGATRVDPAEALRAE